LLTDERSRRGVETAERGADGLASEAECQAAWCAAHQVFMEAKGEEPFDADAPYAPVATDAFAAYSASCLDSADVAASCAAESLAYRAGARNGGAWAAALQAERAVQCDLLRELFGKPFRPVSVAPSWLSWDDGAVVRQARAIYEERRWAEMPRLADALVAAGCRDEGLLAHCRQGGEHVRGCWVVDALLGKEQAIHTGLLSRREWLTCPDPTPLLAFLKDRATDRQWRLFAVACCRSVWHLLTDERSRNAVAVAERYASGLATEEELAHARAGAEVAAEEARRAEWHAEAEANFCYTADYCKVGATLSAARAARAAVSVRANEPDGERDEGCWYWAAAALGDAARSRALAEAAGGSSEGNSPDDEADRSARAVETAMQADLIQDIFGDLLGPLTETPAWLPWADGTVRWSLAPSPRDVSVDPAWLAWSDGVVGKLAAGCGEEGAPDRLPILADALEEAGCDDGELLGHLRGPGPHVKGCWVLNALRLALEHPR
jgi:hypothetical protein